MRPIVTDRVAWSVCLSVCLSVTVVSPAETAEPIEMPFGLRTRVGPRNHVLDGGQHPPWEGAILKVYGHSAGICAKTAEPIDLPFGLWTRVGPRKHKFNRIRQTAPMFPHGRAHCRHLANANEPSVCCCYAALCQITLTTCYLRERLCGRAEVCYPRWPC